MEDIFGMNGIEDNTTPSPYFGWTKFDHINYVGPNLRHLEDGHYANSNV
jgi:hypothetical protein